MVSRIYITSVKSYTGGYPISIQTKDIFWLLLFSLVIYKFWKKTKIYCVIFIIAQLIFFYNMLYYYILNTNIETKTVLILQTIGLVIFLISSVKTGYLIYTSNLEFLLRKKRLINE